VLAAALAFIAPPAGAQVDLLRELRTVKRVRIEGTREVSAGDLRRVLKTQSPSRWPWADKPSLRPDFLRADTSAIRLYYRHRGHLEAHATFRVEGAEGGSDAVVVFTVVEGPVYRIADVVLEDVRDELVPAIRKRIWSRPGRAWDPAYLHLDTLLISAVHQDHGFRPRTVARAGVDTAHRVSVAYRVSEGPRYRIGEIRVSGIQTVDPRLVTRELLLERDGVYSRTRVQRSQERLYETGLFKQVQFSSRFDSSDARVTFDLRVSERKRRWVDAGIGSGTSERFRIDTEWGARNLFNRGLENAVGARLSFYGDGKFQRARLDYTLREPWLFGSRTRGEITPYAELYDDRAVAAYVLQQRYLGLDLRLTRELNRYAKLSLAQRNQWVEQDVDYAPSPVPPTPLDVAPRYQTHSLQLQGTRDTRDHPLFPARGSSVVASLEGVGGILASSSSFLKGELIPAWYTPLSRGMVFAARLRLGVIKPREEDGEVIVGGEDPVVSAIPLEDRFRAGGVNSVRGYNENSIPPDGGLAVIEGSVEVRMPLARVPVLGALGFESFVDAGNVWTRAGHVKWSQFAPSVSRDPLDASDVRWVVGAGPRLDSPIGPIRMNVSWNLRPVEGVRGYLDPVIQFAVGPSY
jgi:outer membrane protein assembly complex protein YaeT